MEMLWYLNHGEAPKADLILGRMSEAGICLLTGEMEDVLAMPVDLNTNNMLPTNMANISKKILEDITYTYLYSYKCNYGITIVFNTAPCFIEYNKAIINGLSDRLPQPKHNFLEIYELLMTHHVKGIEAIKFEEDDSQMTWIQFQRHWFSSLEKMKNKKLKIITSVN